MKTEMFKKSIGYSIMALVILFLFEIIAYFGFLKNIPNFLSHYGVWLIYLNISVVALSAAIWYILSYKSNIACMTGMMIGMTVGMQTGMMLGAVLGATSGFFTGAMAGMIIGVAAGAILGKCCGVMGVMEGMMAGLMGGTMGAMISVMMISDHIQIFMPVFMVINILILYGLMYMFNQEVVQPNKTITRKNIDLLTFVAATVIVAFILIVVMVYGPKSVAFAF